MANVLGRKAISWAKPHDVVSVIAEGVYFVCGHVELLHVRATRRLPLRG